MKKFNLLSLLLFFIVGSALAQMSNKKVATINENEVPVIVRNSFEKEFGPTGDGGEWSVYYSTSRLDGKMVATPIWYTFTRTNTGEKAEVRFLPNGKLKSARGVAKREKPGEERIETKSDQAPPSRR
jgi:hypothetical protein